MFWVKKEKVGCLGRAATCLSNSQQLKQSGGCEEEKRDFKPAHLDPTRQNWRHHRTVSPKQNCVRAYRLSDSLSQIIRDYWSWPNEPLNCFCLGYQSQTPGNYRNSCWNRYIYDTQMYFLLHTSPLVSLIVWFSARLYPEICGQRNKTNIFLPNKCQ